LAFIPLAILLSSAPSLRADDHKIDKWFSSDKFKHFSVSAFYTTGTSIVADKHFDLKEDRSLTVGIGFTISLGGAKEIVDLNSKDGAASVKDLIWDLAGVLAGAIAAKFIL
jgi:putative lipoprotein